MCNSVPSAGPAIQLPLGRTLTQTSTPVVPPNNSSSQSASGAAATTPPLASTSAYRGQALNLSV